MNITTELTRTILTIALTLLSLLTSMVGMKYKKSKKELLNFGYDVLIMLAGSLLTLGTFGIIVQLILIKVKSFIGFYELAKLSEAELRKYKKPFVTLVWLSILGEFISFVFEAFKLLP